MHTYMQVDDPAKQAKEACDLSSDAKAECETILQTHFMKHGPRLTPKVKKEQTQKMLDAAAGCRFVG